MKYLLYVLTMLPMIPMIFGLGNAIDTYDYVIDFTGRWMSIWLILMLSLGPMMRTLRIRGVAWAKRPIGLAVWSWAILHFMGYLLFTVDPLGLALSEIVLKPFLWMGAISLVLLSMLGLTSTDWAVKKLGAAKWRLLHQLGVWAAVIGTLHGLVGQKVALNEYGAYAAVILLLVLWRGVEKWRKL